MNAKRHAACLLLGIALAGCAGASSPPSPALAPAIPASPATDVPTLIVTDAPTEVPIQTPTEAPGSTSTPTVASGEIAFTATVDGVEGVYDTNVASGMTTRLADGRAPAWSPDGTRIAFGRISSDGGFTLWLMNADGSGVHSLGSGLDPYWSPDGTRIAFSTSPVDLGDLWIMNADGNGRKRLEGGLGGVWSPDGTRIASATDAPGGGVPHLVVARADGSGTTRLGSGQLPAWSPDGARIAFVSWSAQPAIGVIDPTTGTISTVATLETDAHALAWSADGMRLSFITAGGDLRVVSAQGGEVTTAATGLSPDAVRSPDGDWFAFTVAVPESTTSDVFLSRADGSDRQQLTTSGAASGPAWRPTPRGCNC